MAKVCKIGGKLRRGRHRTDLEVGVCGSEGRSAQAPSP